MTGPGRWVVAGLAGLLCACPAAAQGRAAAEGDASVDPDVATRLYDAHGHVNPQYHPLRHFAIEPHWSTLEAYAWELDARRRAVGERGVPPPDPALEAMKAALEKGAYGASPPPRRDIDALQAFAFEAIRTGEPDIRREASAAVRDALQLWSDAFPYDGEQALAAFATLELPPVRASLFADDGALAAAGDTPQELSGRFGIAHRWVITPAKAPAADDYAATLYDIGAAAELLVRPLQRVRLFADGTLAAAPDHARRSQSLTMDDHGCGDWRPGFAFGALDATDPAWAAYGDWLPDAHAEAAQPDGLLYAFWLPQPPPAARATVSRASRRLDPLATGFVATTTHVFDLDHDTVPDLLVWEGAGPGPGHMDGPTLTDDTWYRLVLANIGGRWHLLGTDQFSYGCGC